MHKDDKTKDESVSQTYSKAVRCKDASMWIAAMEEKAEALQKLRIWEFIILPKKERLFEPTGRRNTRETETERSLEQKHHCWRRYIRKLQEKIFFDIFASVSKYAAVRFLFLLKITNRWERNTIDIENAFVNANFQEKFTTTQPERFSEKGKKKDACRLNKALHELTQSSRE